MTHPSTPRLLIRADASRVIGAGHVMSCLALAQAWQDAGGTAEFACAEVPPSLADRLRQEGFRVHALDVVPGSSIDADQLRSLGESVKPAWVVVDGDRFRPDFQAAVQDDRWSVLVIDDEARQPAYHGQVILNQNLGISADLYKGPAPLSRLLIGCRYAMLRREFRSRPRSPVEFSDRVRRVLVSLGGADPFNYTRLVVDACCRAAIPDCELHVLIGHANPSQGCGLPSGQAGGKRVVEHRTPANLAELMAGCDMAIVAAGSSIYEIAYLGVPLVAIVTVDNQRAGAAELERLGGAVRIDANDSAALRQLDKTIETFAQSPAQRRRCAEIARALVDGRGAIRVVEELR